MYVMIEEQEQSKVTVSYTRENNSCLYVYIFMEFTLAYIRVNASCIIKYFL